MNKFRNDKLTVTHQFFFFWKIKPIKIIEFQLDDSFTFYWFNLSFQTSCFINPFFLGLFLSFYLLYCIFFFKKLIQKTSLIIGILFLNLYKDVHENNWIVNIIFIIGLAFQLPLILILPLGKFFYFQN